MKKIARLLTIALTAGSVFAITTQQAQAATCATSAQVFVSPVPNLYIVKRETDPTNGAAPRVRINVPDTGGPYAITVKIGGTGLAAGSARSGT